MASKAPPRGLVLLADWSNVIAGVCLTVSFSVLCAAVTFDLIKLAGTAGLIFKATMTAEGIFYALAAWGLIQINMMTDQAAGAVSQTIICFGGIFFAISGFGDGLPAKIISLRYVIPLEGASHGNFADACPFYGITCFMVATTMGMRGVWGLPKNQLISPFWGVACFFMGAWTIGVIGLWGPCLLDGLTSYDDLSTGEQFTLPPYAWGWIHVFQVIGAIFLLAGAIIFGAMDGIFGPCGKKGDILSDTENSSESDENA